MPAEWIFGRSRLALSASTDQAGGESELEEEQTGDGPGAGQQDDGRDTEAISERPGFEELMRDPGFKEEVNRWAEGWFRERWEREEKKRQREAQKQHDQELAEKEEFEQLAAEQAKTIEALETDLAARDSELADWQTRAEAAEGAVQVHVERLKENVDEAVRELLEARPLAKQLEWLTAHAPTAEEDKQDFEEQEARTPQPKRPVPPSPGGDDPGRAQNQRRREEAQVSSSRRYHSRF